VERTLPDSERVVPYFLAAPSTSAIDAPVDPAFVQRGWRETGGGERAANDCRCDLYFMLITLE